MTIEARGDCSNFGRIYVGFPRSFMHSKLLLGRKGKWDKIFKVLGIGGSRVNEGLPNPSTKLFETRFPLDPSRCCNIADTLSPISIFSYFGSVCCDLAITLPLWCLYEETIACCEVAWMVWKIQPSRRRRLWRWQFSMDILESFLWDVGASFECYRGYHIWDPASNIKQRFTLYLNPRI